MSYEHAEAKERMADQIEMLRVQLTRMDLAMTLAHARAEKAEAVLETTGKSFWRLNEECVRLNTEIRRLQAREAELKQRIAELENPPQTFVDPDDE